MNDNNILINEAFLKKRLLDRAVDSHKGDFGHLLIISGSDSMPGAASLCTGAALRSGCGLVTLHTSRQAAFISAIHNPSAMLSLDAASHFTKDDIELWKYDTVVIGPGIGRSSDTAKAVISIASKVGERGLKLILDADALNIFSSNLSLIPKGSILTPHDGELERLVPYKEGKVARAKELCSRTSCTVIAKGPNTKIYTPSLDHVLENTSGGPWLAKGGSGDVLCGLLGGLVSRGYSIEDAAALGVWLHGKSGDLCREVFGDEACCSKDFIDFIPKAFLSLCR